THTAPDTSGHTTVEQRVDGEDPEDGYRQLGLVGGEDYTVRDGASEPDSGAPAAQAGRETRRQSLAYFAQLTDFQVADEESPARVEFLDPGPSSAWRPQEAFTPFMVDATVRQVNFFVPDSPFPGSTRPMDIALITGDQADNNHRNETIWIRELLEGGEALRFDTGIDPTGYGIPPDHPIPLPGCVEAQLPTNLPGLKAEADANNYTGVQDYDDYNAPEAEPLYYDPDEPAGQYADWPMYTGLMDRAQQIVLTPAGLDVPFYMTNGNHDTLVQGNEDANREFERIALGCEKVLLSTGEPGPGLLDPSLFDPESPFSTATMLIPPDPQRQFVSKAQIKHIYADDQDPDEGHGFELVNPDEDAASAGSASYYAWDPETMPGFRFISLDTTSEGGQTAEGVAPGSSNGNLDDPQFQWLEAELEAAQAANQLIVIFGHHPVRSMNTLIFDEQAPPCTGADDGHGHDPNPGCDMDPRSSQPIHLGDDPASPGQTFVELLEGYPNVIAYVPGHTHEHRLTPFPREDGTVWWELNTSAVVDHPTQSRLIELFDNQDGTLSIFTNVIDHASDSMAPGAGDASAFDANELASIGRTFAYNDPQNNFSGEGVVEDRNAELLLDDPRDGVPNPPGGDPSPDPSPTPGAGAPRVVLELDAKKKQNAKRIKVFATCLQTACEVTLGGKARAPGDKAKLKKQTISLQAGETEKVALRPRGRDERRELKHAVRGEGGKAKVKGKATTAAGAKDREKLKIKLKG
ncbi:MAG: hypothetical protein ACRDJ5_00510, partial [Actinomycetota bacterium]